MKQILAIVLGVMVALSVGCRPPGKAIVKTKEYRKTGSASPMAHARATADAVSWSHG